MAAPTRRMLIVDDEQRLCRSLAEFFRLRGFVVLSAHSGEEALACLKEGPIDAALIDILLPGIHGLEVVKQTKQLYPTARIVVITALEDDDLRAKATELGADAYVTKPFALSDEAWSMVLSLVNPSEQAD
jgi:DNA-binding response OmpR family regulator